MFANATRILTSSAHTVAMAAIFSLLILVGCASPAQDLSSSADVTEQETMEVEAAENDSMADTDDSVDTRRR